MALTKVEIISNALCVMGHDPIQTLDNADALTIAAEQAYNMLLPSLLTEGNWRFATQIAQLSKSVETPPTYWKNVFLLPADWLKTIRVYPQSYDYEIYQSKEIYTNMDDDFYMEYIFQPDESLFPSYFVPFLVMKIAAYLALSNAQKPEFYQTLEAKATQQQAIASAIDAQNRPNFHQAVFPVLDRRNIGGYSANSISPAP